MNQPNPYQADAEPHNPYATIVRQATEAALLRRAQEAIITSYQGWCADLELAAVEAHERLDVYHWAKKVSRKELARKLAEATGLYNKLLAEHRNLQIAVTAVVRGQAIIRETKDGKLEVRFQAKPPDTRDFVEQVPETERRAAGPNFHLMPKEERA